MIDIRYHIYSLAAVFFALAVGIVIGTSFSKGSSSTVNERRTITRYENSMRVLKREIENAADECSSREKYAEKSEDFCKSILPIVAKGRLAWRNVAIVQTGDYDDLSGSIKRALELAGATVTSITDISREFKFEDDKKIANVLAECGVIPPTDAKEARNKLFSIITSSLYAAKNTEMLSILEEQGVAKFTGDYDRFNKLVVLVGGSTTEGTSSADDVDTLIIDQLQQAEVNMVGCESTAAVCSYVPVWHKMGIATVDNADSAIGQVALLCALNGERAKFGIKDTADRLTPQTLEIK